MTAGQRMIVATRMPPSYSQPLPARSGTFDVGRPSAVDRPPLSDVNSTIVFFAEPQFVELVEHHSHGRVHLFDHRGVRRMILHEPHLLWRSLPNAGLAGFKPAAFASYFAISFSVRLQRNVDRVERQIREERPLAIGVDELARLVGQPQRQRLARRAVRQAADCCTD